MTKIRVSFKQPKSKPLVQPFIGSRRTKWYAIEHLADAREYSAAELLTSYTFKRRTARGYVEVAYGKKMYKVFWDGTCTCPDYMYRRMNSSTEVCKHVKAVRALYGIEDKVKPIVTLQELYA